MATLTNKTTRKTYKSSVKKSNLNKPTKQAFVLGNDYDNKGGKMAFLYDKITNLLIAQLEKGVIPWKRQYNKNTIGLPQNYISKRPYTSINMLLLGLLPYENPYYVTKKQIDTLGGRIKKGESGTVLAPY